MSQDVEAILQEYQQRLEQVGQRAVDEFKAKVVDGTPVDSGAARQSWQDNGAFKLDKSYELFSDLESVEQLEYGHSDQAPQGMLRIAAEQWPAILARHADATGLDT